MFIQSCFPHLTEDVHVKVLSFVMHKFQVTVPVDEEELVLYNFAGEKIIIQNGFYLNLFYFSEDTSFLCCIKQFLQQKEERKVRLRDKQNQRLKELL